MRLRYWAELCGNFGADCPGYACRTQVLLLDDVVWCEDGVSAYGRGRDFVRHL